MKKPKVLPPRGSEKVEAFQIQSVVLISVRLPAVLATQVKIVAQTQGGLSKFVGKTLHEKIQELRNDPNFMEELYEDE